MFFYPTGVRLFLLDASGHPVDASHLTAHATFYHPDAPDTPWFSRPLHPDLTAPDHLPASLDLSVGLASAPRTGAMVDFQILGLESKTSSTAEFKVPLEFVTETPIRSVVGSSERIPVQNLTATGGAGFGPAGPSIAPQPMVVPFAYAPATSYVPVSGALLRR